MIKSTLNPAPLDFIISGGMVVDGCNRPPYRADVGVAGSRIVEVGDLHQRSTLKRFDATGKVVAPGFIDSHTHDDTLLLRDRTMRPKISQGVTTVVTGNCGISIAPLGLKFEHPPAPLTLLDTSGDYRFSTFRDYLDALRATPAATNSACLVGHSTLRAVVMSELDRPANALEVDKMRQLVDEAMRAGAIGASTGTFYPPAAHATTEELIEVCQPLSAHGGIYATHMRDEGDNVVAALYESFRIGKTLSVPVIISHHKVVGQRNFGRSTETLGIILKAMRNQTIALDAYPYIAGSSMLRKDLALLASKTLVTWCKPFPELAGRSLDELSEERGMTVSDLIAAIQPAGAIYFNMDESDVRRILSFPGTMIGSDGLPHDDQPHPRLWGTFPRVLGHYSRDQGLFPLETAVWKMTGLTAQNFGLRDRGVIRPGAFADLVVFAADEISDAASFESPTKPATGISSVFVNGTQVWTDGEPTGRFPGQILARTPGSVTIASVD